MNTTRLDATAAVLAAVSNTIENMVFSPTEESRMIWARLAALSPLKGEFIMFLPEPLARDLAAGLSGGEAAELPERAVLDCVAELLNIIAGQFLESVLSADVEFSLGLPTSGAGSCLDLPASSKCFYLRIDEKCFSLVLSSSLLRAGGGPSGASPTP